MTFKELEQIYALHERVKSAESMIDYRRSTYGAGLYTGGHRDPVGDIVTALEKAEAKLEGEKAKLKGCIQTVKWFINEIEIPLLKEIAEHRYLQFMSWEEVANKIGGDIAPENCIRLVKKYLKRKRLNL